MGRAWMALLLTGCAFGDIRTQRDGGPDAAVVDAGRADGGVDAGRVDGGRMDAGGVDAGYDAGRVDAGHDAGPPSTLDPALGLADPSGTPCTTPGSMGECPGIEVCRFYTSTEGRCESCEPCGNLNDSCTQSSECDILFVCYSGFCTNICPLGTSYCGAVEDCIDVGHPTHGVCAPF